jgi:hypothetical protein
VYRVDRDTGSVLQTITLPVTYSTSRAPFISFGEGAMWLMGTDTFGKSILYKVNPATGAVLLKKSLPASVLYTWGLAYFNGAVWTVSNQGTESGRVYKLDPGTGAVLRSFVAAGPPVLPYGICSDTEGALWMVSYYKRAYLIDAGETTWLRMEPHPLFGTVPGLSSMNATVAFDSGNAGHGIHTANLHMVSNDAETPDLPVPVTFRVHKPVALFTGLPATGTTPLLVNLDASASYDLPGETFTYEWTFGDGSVANGMQVNHTYLTAGTFTVTLKITDGIGATGSASQTINVAAGAPQPEDSDGNGLPDVWENFWFNQIGVNPNADPDGDGCDNLQEYVMGTNPRDPNSVLRIQLIPQGEGSAIIRFQRHSASGPGYADKTRTYRLESVTTLHTAIWDAVPGYEAIPALDDTVDCPVETTNSSGFFRVRVILQ